MKISKKKTFLIITVKIQQFFTIRRHLDQLKISVKSIAKILLLVLKQIKYHEN